MIDLLDLIERMRAALDSAPSYTEEALAAEVGASPAAPVFQEALRALDDRMEILVDPASRTVRGRRRFTAQVVEALGDGNPATLADLRKALDVEGAALADVLGWLRREGRVDVADADDGRTVRLKRGHSGPRPLQGADGSAQDAGGAGA